jgi:hypothetical protein
MNAERTLLLQVIVEQHLSLYLTWSLPMDYFIKFLLSVFFNQKTTKRYA